MHVVDRAVVVSVVRWRPRRGDSAEAEARAKCARWRVGVGSVWVYSMEGGRLDECRAPDGWSSTTTTTTSTVDVRARGARKHMYTLRCDLGSTV